MAFVFPVEGGYISIRFKPSSALFHAAQSLYPPTLEVEEKEGMDGSIPFLLGKVKEAGFSGYQDFMIQAAFAELTSLKDKGHVLNLPQDTTGVLREITGLGTQASQSLNDAFLRIKSFQAINQNFLQTMDDLSLGFHHLKFIALNMTVAAAKFGNIASSLGVVAKEFSDLSEQIRSNLGGLADFIKILSEVVQKCALSIVALEAQMLMVEYFIKESIGKLKSSDDAFADMVENRALFSKLFREYAEGLERELTGLEGQLDGMLDQMVDVQKFTTGLEVIRQIGAVESARVSEVREVFIHYLEEMHKFISLLRTTSKGIESNVKDIQNGCGLIKESVVPLAALVDTIFDLASTYSRTEGLSRGA